MATLLRNSTLAVTGAALLVAHLLTPAVLWRMPLSAALSRESVGPKAIAPRTRNDATKERLTEQFDKIPLRFEENREASGNDAKFVARAGGAAFGIKPTEVVTRLQTEEQSFKTPQPAVASPARAEVTAEEGTKPYSPRPRRKCVLLRMQLVGANRRARVSGESQLATRTNYFIGNDPQRWHPDVANYERVRVEQVYQGVDVVYYGSARQLEYDFKIAPGADYRKIRVKFAGAKGLKIDSAGRLVIDTVAGVVRQPKSIAYQEANGVRKAVLCRYLIQHNMVRFALGDYNAHQPLVIDPVLSYSTLLGYATQAQAIAVDSAGNAYVAGTVGNASGLPATPGAAQEKSASFIDAFISKFDPKGSRLIYSTYLGGSGDDAATSIAIDRDGNAYVTGYTFSSNFPVTAGAFQTVKPGGPLDKSAFVVKLNPIGDAFMYSTYLSGREEKSDSYRVLGQGLSIAVDAFGSSYVTGYTESSNFPTKGAAQPRCGAGFIRPCADAFVTKLNAMGTDLVYSTYLGGAGIDVGRGIALDGSGNAYVVGDTSSSNFPLINPLQNSNHSSPCAGGNALSLCNDAFAVKLNADGNALIYSTYIGGSGDDQANAVAVDAAGSAYITGSTNSSDFPVTAAALQDVNASGTVLKSRNGGNKWTLANKGLPTNADVLALVSNPASPDTVYAGTTAGMFKSVDAGVSWRSVGPQNVRVVNAFAIDPNSPSTIYASGFVGVRGYDLFKSLDGGESWGQIVIRKDGFAEPYIASLAVDPTNSSILYVAGQRLLKSTNAGRDWIEIDNGLPGNATVNIYAVAIDPTTPSNVYVALNGNFIRPGVYRSTDGGFTWEGRYSGLLYGGGGSATLVIDPLTTSTLYSSVGFSLFKSTNSGETWSETSLHGYVTSAALDPGVPTRIYAGNQTGLLRSDDGGATSQLIMSGIIRSIAIDSNMSSTVYVGRSTGGADAFVVKVNPMGSALVYSTYVGGSGDESGNAVAVDSAGNVYVAGETRSLDFKVANAFQPDFGGGATQPGGLQLGDAFVMKLNASGSALLYASYLGTGLGEKGSGIALDGLRNVYVSGVSDSVDFPTTPGAYQTKGDVGNKAFIIKIGVPTILAVSIAGNKLIVRGDSFDSGAVVLVDGVQQRTLADQENPTNVLIAKKVLGKIALGQTVAIRVRNSDGTLSNEFAFTRNLE